MNNPEQALHTVAIVGAGPAGLFAAKELADNGVRVALFNRDIKPGGLAEYGIYPEKYRMKEGLRKQFRQILAHENITYFGNVFIGQAGDVSLDQLRQMGFQAVLVTAGAQGTKWLGLPGEELKGVYHAKDIVYHYNYLPPFSQEKFHIGKRAVIIGVGNVMTDIARYLATNLKLEEIIVIARRGPAEIKFDRAELQEIISCLDLEDLDAEFERVKPLMLSLGQDPEAPRDFIYSALAKAVPTGSPTRLIVRFLMSPMRILGDENGQVTGLEVEHNTLIPRNGDTRARGMGTFEVLDVDTVIFAIGDRVDEKLGLPVEGSEFCKASEPRFPTGDASYEVYDPQTGEIVPDIFVAGWSRKASTGLVGIARKDGVNGARAIMQYLQTLPQARPDALEQAVEHLRRQEKPVVEKQDLVRLEILERERAQQLGQEEFRFNSNEAMLEVLVKER